MRNLFSVLAITIAASLPCQDWRTEQVVDAGIEFDIPSRLERLPMQLGSNALYQRARMRPKDTADYVRAQYEWYCDVLEFSKKEPKGDDSDLPPGVPEEFKEQLRKLLASAGRNRHKSFKEWLGEKDKETITIEVEAKLKKGKAGKLDYAHWVWKEKSGFGPAGTVYCEAAVYSFPEREVALVIEMPLETANPGVPKGKWKTLIDRMIPSGKAVSNKPLGAAAAEAEQKRDQHANTPEKQKALADAKKNIGGLNGWDYFTAPSYIVIYSWDFEKPEERAKARKDAEYYSARLEKMRALYLAAYPLDATGTKAVRPDPNTIPTLGGPKTGSPTKPPAPAAEPSDATAAGEPAKEKLGRVPYPVFRLCATYEQFQKYGQSPPGVVGWFSPASKELVVFLGGDKMMGQGATETVTYHEGWHQYADFYFDHPEKLGNDDLHRWFDEGHGDYFGSYRWGVNGWKYVGSDMRYDDVKAMVRAGDYIPFKDLVHWDRQKFYSERAPYYYAQAFSMIDYLRRGEKDRNWQPRYAGILDMYRKVMLVYGDSKQASDTAFKDFTDADWKALEDAWKGWVNSPNFMSGK